MQCCARGELSSKLPVPCPRPEIQSCESAFPPSAWGGDVATTVFVGKKRETWGGMECGPGGVCIAHRRVHTHPRTRSREAPGTLAGVKLSLFTHTSFLCTDFTLTGSLVNTFFPPFCQPHLPSPQVLTARLEHIPSRDLYIHIFSLLTICVCSKRWLNSLRLKLNHNRKRT